MKRSCTVKRGVLCIMTTAVILSDPVHVSAGVDFTDDIPPLELSTEPPADLSTELPAEISTELPAEILTGSPKEDIRTDVYDTSTAGKLPSKYNLYKRSRLPSVKDQEPYQSCWAFAVIGAMESDLIADGKRKKDLSEAHLAYYVTNKYKDPKKCRKDTVSKNGSHRQWIDNGGRAYQGLHVLSNMIGAVRESDAPYERADEFHPDSSYITSKDYARLDSASYISSLNRSGIKRAIMEHGGVIASYYDEPETYYSDKYNSYYCRVKDLNHTVMLVGWDDGFPKEKFVRRAKRDGAWLVRNSRGQNGYGRNGYFWLSYSDLSFKYSGEVIAVDADRKTFDNCYAYDGQPIKDSIRYAKSSRTVQVEYNVKPNETIKAVGFEIRTDKVDTLVTVTNNRTGESVTGSLYCEYGGFHTIRLDKALKIRKKANVTVSLKFTPKSADKVAIVCEKKGTFTAGRGDYKYKGVCDKGFKIGKHDQNCDPRIKLYTNDIRNDKK